VILTSFRKDKLDNESRRVFLDFQAVYWETNVNNITEA
jgi:hypothetical protein